VNGHVVSGLEVPPQFGGEDAPKRVVAETVDTQHVEVTQEPWRDLVPATCSRRAAGKEIVDKFQTTQIHKVKQCSDHLVFGWVSRPKILNLSQSVPDGGDEEDVKELHAGTVTVLVPVAVVDPLKQKCIIFSNSL
jgi:hypothetical protein